MSSLSASSSARNLRTLVRDPEETVSVNLDGNYQDVTSENIGSLIVEAQKKIELLTSRAKDLKGKKNKRKTVELRIDELKNLRDLLEDTSDKIAKKAARAAEVS